MKIYKQTTWWKKITSLKNRTRLQKTNTPLLNLLVTFTTELMDSINFKINDLSIICVNHQVVGRPLSQRTVL